MQLNNRKIIGAILIFFMCGFLTVSAQNIEVVFKGVRSTKGRLVIAVFKDDPSFQEDKPYIRKKFKKTGISNGELIVKFSLDPGTYGFALHDDENDDDVMNYNMIGIPKEGFGFSDYYHSGLTRPKFDVFKFDVNENQKKKIIIKVKYM